MNRSEILQAAAVIYAGMWIGIDQETRVKASVDAAIKLSIETKRQFEEKSL